MERRLAGGWAIRRALVPKVMGTLLPEDWEHPHVAFRAATGGTLRLGKRLDLADVAQLTLGPGPGKMDESAGILVSAIRMRHRKRRAGVT